MHALVLCGGRGTRAWPATAEIPKPMLEIGGRPVLHHLMSIYASQGITQFVLAAGYRQSVISHYCSTLSEPWEVDVVDTGEATDTGDRVLACLDRLGEQFMATYGDGLAPVNLTSLLRTHQEHGAGATITVVPLPCQYGTLVTDASDHVVDFREKPRLPDHLINAGFFVFDRAALDGLTGASLERDILPELSLKRQLIVYRHDGFWRSMDTHKDVTELNELASQEDVPWLSKPT